MSNKTLSLIIIIIIVAFAGSVVFLKTRGGNGKQYNTDEVESFTQENMNNSTQEENEESQNNAVEPGSVAGDALASGCKRNFDAEKLKTAQVSITKRQAQMSVKGFGNITVEFYEKDSPKTVENFLRLANSGYFDCLTFHRVAKGFVIQGGDPTGTGSGGESAFGGAFADETNASSELYKTGYKKGILAMANAGPNTNTSQFFIMLEDVALPPDYTIFGRVVSGIEVVEKIGQVEIIPQMRPNDGAPKTPVVMESVKIIK